MKKGDDKKLRELILYIAEQSSQSYIGSTKMGSIIFLVDMAFFKKTKKNVLGRRYSYSCNSYHPYPKGYFGIMKSLKAKGLLVTEEIKSKMGKLTNLKASRPADTDIFHKKHQKLLREFIPNLIKQPTNTVCLRARTEYKKTLQNSK